MIIPLVITVLAFSCYQQVYALPAWMSGSFSTFVDTVVKEEDRSEFCAYYDHFLATLKQQSSAAQKKSLEALYKTAHTTLKLKHPNIKDLAASWQELSKSPAKPCLVRYGAYEQFLKERASRHASVWRRVYGYAKQVPNRVAAWFRPGKHQG